MSLPIEDYALIGNGGTAALISRAGSLDWLCAPRLDSPACFAALLGDARHGRWLLAPAAPSRTQRRYREGTLILETHHEVPSGEMRVVDLMPLGSERCDVVRIATGLRGSVEMRMELVVRFDYGSVVPWVRRVDDALLAVGGPDALTLRTPVEHAGEDLRTVAEFTLPAGRSVAFVLSWHPSHRPPPPPLDPEAALAESAASWEAWARRMVYRGSWAEAVLRSLLTLKALTFDATGAIAAAPTTSLPERLGGPRNWDYRYCWLRDATFTLYALALAGYREEARAWREWLLRAAAGRGEDLQIVYGLAGERRLVELELPWLPGYAGSAPVRVGNAAYRQLQLDVYGEVMDALHVARRTGLEPEESSWELQRELLEFLESAWERPDEGIWEVRGGPRQFTYSKVMSWVAFDRAVKAVERSGFPGPVERWRGIRDSIHAEVCRRAWDPAGRTFVQDYGSRRVDASLLLLPLVGFLPPEDPRIAGTVRAVRDRLTSGGLVRRYEPDPRLEGVSGGEGAFLPCSFWLADNLALQGREDEARRLFERLLALRNDVGLLSEEYDPQAGRMLGNFPQALSHVALVNTAFNLSHTERAMLHRSRD
jgi:GH15 family glucan-1,4-alpha-glucosidase